MAELIKVSPGVLAVGKPLPWPLYNAKGKLLVSQGHVIANVRQLDQLYQLGLFYPSRERRERLRPEDTLPGIRISPFAEYAGLLEDLESHLNSFLKGEDSAQKKVLGLARRIDQLCGSDADACLALVHIYSVEPTAYEQTLFYAIICALVGRELGLEAARTIPLMGAALTANMALLPFQDKLNNSKTTLSEQQRQVIRKHPQLSTAALRKTGVSNPTWLATVEQHHECADGSGYPQGLSGNKVCEEARVLALAERYTAMITRRAYRQRRPADEALREIVRSAQDDTDRRIRQALAQVLSPYPPGVLVLLANRETAVVTHRSQQEGAPRIKAVINATGNAFHGGFLRDPQQDDFAIQEIVVPEMLPALNLADLWGYH